MKILIYALIALISYLIGSISWSYIIGAIKGIDVRSVGSGNLGTTNSVRALGKTLGALVFVGDFGKGFLVAFLGHYFMGPWGGVVAAIFAILGHVFPFWLKFKGGKGAACGLGVLMALAPAVGIIIIAIWFIVIFATRYVSLATIIAAASAPISALLLREEKLYTFFLFLGAILVIVMHRSNIKRILDGTENKVTLKKKK